MRKKEGGLSGWKNRGFRGEIRKRERRCEKNVGEIKEGESREGGRGKEREMRRRRRRRRRREWGEGRRGGVGVGWEK